MGGVGGSADADVTAGSAETASGGSDAAGPGSAAGDTAFFRG